MTINTTTLEANLTTKINATTGSTDGKEFLLLGKAIEAITPTVTVQSIITEGTTQVGLVTAEGTTQVNTVLAAVDSVLIDTDIGVSVGYVNIPQNSQSSNYTLALGDSGKHIFHPSTDTTARTFTIPANASVAYPIGTALTFVNMTSQVVSIAITTDVMNLAKDGTTGTRSLAQYGSATAIKIESALWLISGSALT